MGAPSYPLSLPAEFKSAEISLEANSVVGVAESPFTLTEQVYVHQGQRIEGSIVLPAMKRATAEPVIAFLLKLNGAEGTFYCGDTANKTARGVATGAPKTAGIATARAWTLATDGWTAGTTNILRAGDWIQVGTGSTRRLHKVLEDVNSDGGGAATLTLWPRVRTAYADNTDLVVSSPTGLFRLKEAAKWDINLAKVYGITIGIIESMF